MTIDQDREHHSKRRHKTVTKANKQAKIAKQYGMQVDSVFKYAKKHAMACGDPECFQCGNPRKFFNEETLQERSHKQTALEWEVDDGE